MSAGVARQYCGKLGKVENCQVGVFAAFFNGFQAGIINSKLYLPKDWTDDIERCKKAHIPIEVVNGVEQIKNEIIKKYKIIHPK